MTGGCALLRLRPPLADSGSSGCVADDGSGLAWHPQGARVDTILRAGAATPIEFASEFVRIEVHPDLEAKEMTMLFEEGKLQ